MNPKDFLQVLFSKSTTQAVGETTTHAESRRAVVRRLELAHNALQEASAQEGAGLPGAVLRSKIENVQRQQLAVLRLTKRFPSVSRALPKAANYTSNVSSRWEATKSWWNINSHYRQGVVN